VGKRTENGSLFEMTYRDKLMAYKVKNIATNGTTMFVFGQSSRSMIGFMKYLNRMTEWMSYTFSY